MIYTFKASSLARIATVFLLLYVSARAGAILSDAIWSAPLWQIAVVFMVFILPIVASVGLIITASRMTFAYIANLFWR